MAKRPLAKRSSSSVSKSSVAHAEQVVAEVARLKVVIASSFYEMGRALGELLDQKLYAVLGYASFEALLEDRALIGARQARKFIDVAKSFRRDPAVMLGPEKAYALIRYCARTDKHDDPADLVEQGFPLGGKRKPIEVVTVRDIESATRTAIGRQAGAQSQSERARRDAELERRNVLVALHKRGADDVTVAAKFVHGAWRIVIDLPAERARGVLKL